MKIKINILTTITVLGLLLLSSCNDYTDINQNPNSTLYTDLYPEELLAAAQAKAFANQPKQGNVFGQHIVNAWSENPTTYGAGVYQNPQYTMNYTSSFLQEVWDGYYTGIYNFKLIEDYPNSNHKYDNYIAIAKIMKVYYMQYIVDLYGDCPYSEAFKGSLNVTPKYDDDKEIYKSLVLEIENAYNLIDNASPDALIPGSGIDITFAGNMSSWQQFASTVELKLLLRMSNNTGSMATFRDQHLTFLTGKTFISSDVYVNPGYGDASTQQNPFYNYIGASTGNVAPTGHAYKCLANDYQSSQVISGSTINYPYVADPRKTKLFANGSGTSRICAITQGTSTGPDVYDTTSSAAVTIAKLGSSMLTPLGSATAKGANGQLLTAAESYLLQSEAKLRNYLPGGETAAMADFNTAIDKSCLLLKVATTLPNASVTAYKTAINAKPYFGWSTSFTTDQKIAAIMYQKWVALIGFNGLESYIEYTRTGYPILPLSTTCVSHTRRPYRLLYPKSEALYNTDNVPVLELSDIFSINSSSPFWLQTGL